jgi:antitoxin-like ribbon-helix-helix protein
MTQHRQRKRTSLDAIALQSDGPSEGAQVEDSEANTKTARARPVQQTAYLPPLVHEQLRYVAYEERVKMHDLLLEGLDLVFKKRGLPSIEELKKKQR